MNKVKPVEKIKNAGVEVVKQTKQTIRGGGVSG